MFGIGGPELVVILVIGLIFIGPEKLPQVAKTVGGGLRDLRRAANLAQAELRETVDDLIREADIRDAVMSGTEELRGEEPPRAEELDHAAGEQFDASTGADAVAAEVDTFVAAHDPLPDDLGTDPIVAAHNDELDAGLDGDTSRGANRRPEEAGFTFDDDPDDWDPDAFDDSAEPEGHSSEDQGPGPQAPTAVGATLPPDVPPPDTPPPGPVGTRPRSMPPMRATAPTPFIAADMPTDTAAVDEDGGDTAV